MKFSAENKPRGAVVVKDYKPPCWYALYHGGCTSDDCNRNHDEASVLADSNSPKHKASWLRFKETADLYEEARKGKGKGGGKGGGKGSGKGGGKGSGKAGGKASGKGGGKGRGNG